MRFLLTRRAARDYESFPRELQRRIDKQLAFLLADLRHPSLDAKKYDEARDIWQGRVNRDYRFYFSITDDLYTVLGITRHPK